MKFAGLILTLFVFLSAFSPDKAAFAIGETITFEDVEGSLWEANVAGIMRNISISDLSEDIKITLLSIKKDAQKNAVGQRIACIVYSVRIVNNTDAVLAFKRTELGINSEIIAPQFEQIDINPMSEKTVFFRVFADPNNKTVFQPVLQMFDAIDRYLTEPKSMTSFTLSVEYSLRGKTRNRECRQNLFGEPATTDIAGN